MSSVNRLRLSSPSGSDGKSSTKSPLTHRFVFTSDVLERLDKLLHAEIILEDLEQPTPAPVEEEVPQSQTKSAGFKSSFKRIGSNAQAGHKDEDLDGEVMENVDGEAMDEDGEDVDGESMDDVDGEAMDDVDGEAMEVAGP